MEFEGINVTVGLFFEGGEYEEHKVNLFPGWDLQTPRYEQAFETIRRHTRSGLYAKRMIVVKSEPITHAEAARPHAEEVLQRIKEMFKRST